MDSMSGCDIRLVFTFPPKDNTLQYKKCVHLWNNFPCISTLSGRRSKQRIQGQNIILVLRGGGEVFVNLCSLKSLKYTLSSFKAVKGNNNESRKSSWWFLGYLLSQHKFKKITGVSWSFGPLLRDMGGLGLFTLLPEITVHNFLKGIESLPQTLIF